MVSKKAVTWNLPAFEDIRRLPGVDEALQDCVDQVLAQTGEDGYRGDVEDGKSRSRGYVLTTSYDAMLHERWDNVLLKALGNVRHDG